MTATESAGGDWRGRPVAVVGLGMSNIALTRYLLRQGARVGVGAFVHQHRRGRRLSVPDDRGHGGRHVVVDGARGRVHQRVDQLALALLELPDHHHPQARVEQPAPRVLEPLAEVVRLARPA